MGHMSLRAGAGKGGPAGRGNLNWMEGWMGKEEGASPLPSLDWRLGLDICPLGATILIARFGEQDGAGFLSLPWQGLQSCHQGQQEVSEGSSGGPGLSSGPRDADRV